MPARKKTNGRRRRARKPISVVRPPTAVSCTDCGLWFADEASLALHRPDRPNPGSPTRCTRESTLTSAGWKRKGGAWAAPEPPKPPRRRRRSTEEEDAIVHSCLGCGHRFADPVLFEMHQIPARGDGIDELPARCLSRDEMRALNWVRRADGRWDRGLLTQDHWTHISALPTVRGSLWEAGLDVRTTRGPYRPAKQFEQWL